MSSIAVSLGSLIVVLLIMLAESRVSSRNEDRLRQRGAVEPPGDVYRTMQWAYPGAFIVMAVEGAMFGPTPGIGTIAGVVLFTVSKALKFWAMASLGPRWTFRILVLPEPLVTRGPYAVVRHPNYVAVVGELVGMALMVGAWVTGPPATVLFGMLLAKRIRIENRALRHHAC